MLGHLQNKSKEDVFAPVLNETSLKTMLAFGAKHKFKIELFGCLRRLPARLIVEEVFVEKEPGNKGDRSKVYRLLKSLYGLRSSARN